AHFIPSLMYPPAVLGKLFLEGIILDTHISSRELQSVGTRCLKLAENAFQHMKQSDAPSDCVYVCALMLMITCPD
ncbi:Rho guanine nucleotide exchange factor 3, partial [Dissostichus eleginoides]